MRTRLTGPIQTVSKCKRDTSQSISMILQSTKINPLRLMISLTTTSRSHRQSPWETSRTALTCKSPLWMTERKVDQLIFMTVQLLSLCKIEFWFVMTRKGSPRSERDRCRRTRIENLCQVLYVDLWYREGQVCPKRKTAGRSATPVLFLRIQLQPTRLLHCSKQHPNYAKFGCQLHCPV